VPKVPTSKNKHSPSSKAGSKSRHDQPDRQNDASEPLTESEEIYDGLMGQLLQDWTKVLPNVDETSFAIQLRITQIDSSAIRTTNRIASKFGIKQIHIRMLMAIRRAEQDTPTRPSDLWRQFDIAPSAVTHRLDRLIQLGLVARTPHPTDRRGFYIYLTKKGEKTTAKIVSEFHAATLENMKEVDKLPGGRQMLRKFLAALARSWEKSVAEMD
jgi:DNA-binding MarR family transcriptional regulator